MKISEPKPIKEEIFNKHLDYLEVCSHIDDSRYTDLPGCYDVRAGTRIMYDMMYGRILKAMQEYAEAYHKEKLRDELISFAGHRNEQHFLDWESKYMITVSEINDYLKTK